MPNFEQRSGCAFANAPVRCRSHRRGDVTIRDPPRPLRASLAEDRPCSPVSRGRLELLSGPVVPCVGRALLDVSPAGKPFPFADHVHSERLQVAHRAQAFDAGSTSGVDRPKYRNPSSLEHPA